MPTLVIGNSASYDGETNNAAGIATSLGSDFASASSGALTLKHGVDFDNSTSSLKVRRTGQPELGAKGGETITSNTQGPVTITEADAGLFGTEVVVNSGVYLWSDSTSNAALVLNTPCTVTNNGRIIGKGGKGGNAMQGSTDGGETGYAGGPAIEIASSVSGVTITNNSGAYIAGGGGGGGSSTRYGGGGGGAGGGAGGRGGQWDDGTRTQPYAGGSGGGLGSSGGNGGSDGGGQYGRGGGAGGGGAAHRDNGDADVSGGGGGGGGRILPGTGGAAGSYTSTGGAGGSAGNAGGAAGGWQRGGGGGGWGASGGTGGSHGAGAGGAAIKDNGNAYTLSNSGTIYGGT